MGLDATQLASKLELPIKENFGQKFHKPPYESLTSKIQTTTREFIRWSEIGLSWLVCNTEYKLIDTTMRHAPIETAVMQTGKRLAQNKYCSTVNDIEFQFYGGKIFKTESCSNFNLKTIDKINIYSNKNIYICQEYPYIEWPYEGTVAIFTVIAQKIGGLGINYVANFYNSVSDIVKHNVLPGIKSISHSSFPFIPDFHFFDTFSDLLNKISGTYPFKAIENLPTNVYYLTTTFFSVLDLFYIVKYYYWHDKNVFQQLTSNLQKKQPYYSYYIVQYPGQCAADHSESFIYDNIYRVCEYHTEDIIKNIGYSYPLIDASIHISAIVFLKTYSSFAIMSTILKFFNFLYPGQTVSASESIIREYLITHPEMKLYIVQSPGICADDDKLIHISYLQDVIGDWKICEDNH